MYISRIQITHIENSGLISKTAFHMLACQPREMYVYTVPVVELVRKHFAAYATLFFFNLQSMDVNLF